MMKRYCPVVRAALLATLVFAIAGCGGAGSVRLTALPDEARAFVTLVNEHRESIGLTALEWHPQLAGVALAHSQDMVDRNYFDHDNPEGDSPFDRMTAAGIGYTGAAENIAWGQATGEAVLAAWLNSAGHKANIENGAYTHHGVGFVEEANMWTHVFATNPTTGE